MTAPLSEEIKKETIDAFNQCNGVKQKAADLLGIPISTFKKRYNIATKHRSVQGLEPLIPDGQKLRGISSLYKVDTITGERTEVMQWVKTNQDLDRQLEIIRETAEALKEDIPKEPALVYEGVSDKELCSVYVLTDYHIGQMSWAGETGVDWDTDKSSDFLVRWFERAIAAAPASEVGVLCQLGDFLHFDGLEAVTPTSKHVLDADARYPKIVGAAIKAVRRIVKMMLAKHRYVHIIMAEGNHDLASSVWLRAMFADKYEDEPRVTVDNTSLPYYVYQHGKTMLGFHHGHKKSMGDLSKMFAGSFRQMHGQTEFTYIHTGHYHHVSSKEDSIAIVEQHATMAPKDAHSARGGYQSHRGAVVIHYHRQHGEVGRLTIRPEMLK